MTRGLLLPGVADLTDSAFLEQIRGTGYDRIWAGELWGTDAFTQLLYAADELEGDGDTPADVRFGTAIVNAYSRTPATLAQAAATIADRQGRPFRLGLGPSTRFVVENLHDHDYDRPVRRLHETAELVRELTGDGTVEYEGELFEVSGFPGLDADVEIYTAALGPAARRATGRVADGWLPHNVPVPDLADAFETVARTAREADRDPDEITVAPYVPTAVCETEAAARDLIAGHVAYYVGSGDGYRNAVGNRFPDAADAVAEAWRDGDRDAAREAVTEEMVDALGVAGTPETAPERFDEVAATDTVDETILVLPTRADAETIHRTVETLAPTASRDRT